MQCNILLFAPLSKCKSLNPLQHEPEARGPFRGHKKTVLSNYLLLTVKSFYEDIVYSGLGRESSITRQKQTIRFNQFILLILVANFVCVISYFIYGLYISALINLSAAYVFIMAYQLNLRKQYMMGRLLSVVTLNGYLAVMNYMEGVSITGPISW